MSSDGPAVGEQPINPSAETLNPSPPPPSSDEPAPATTSEPAAKSPDVPTEIIVAELPAANREASQAPNADSIERRLEETPAAANPAAENKSEQSTTKAEAQIVSASSPPTSSRAYVVPKLIVTPVDMASEEAEIAANPGFTHAAVQTTITSAPALRLCDDGVTVVDDPMVAESVTVIRRYQRVIRRVFDHYADADTHVLAQAAFVTFCKEFSILPTLIEQDDLDAVFKSVRAGPALSFRDLIACLTRLALTVYRSHPRLNAAEQKLSALFRAMQLDQNDIVLHRLRKSLPASMASSTHDLNAIDFDQKDLDQEVERILDSIPSMSETAAAAAAPNPSVSAYDIIGPLSAQVQTTIDKVKQYTAGVDQRRPSLRAPAPAAVLARRLSTGLGESDPFLRPIIPPGPITTLPPLYYPGMTSSWRRLAAADDPAAAPPSSTRSSEEPASAAAAPKPKPPKADDDRKPGKRRAPVPAPDVVVPAVVPSHEKTKLKARVGEATREKAAKVTAAERSSEQAMQKKHMGQIDKRRGQQLQRLGRQIPTQFAGRYAGPSAAAS